MQLVETFFIKSTIEKEQTGDRKVTDEKQSFV